LERLGQLTVTKGFVGEMTIQWTAAATLLPSAAFAQDEDGRGGFGGADEDLHDFAHGGRAEVEVG
jgi:hypothetical protein